MKNLIIMVTAIALSCFSFAQETLIMEHVAVANPSREINDGKVEIAVYGGQPPYHFYWSDANTDTTSRFAYGLTEGISHHVRVRDAAGNEVERSIKIPAESTAEKFNGVFTPLVGFVGDVLLFDLFAALNLYDNQIYDARGKPIRNPNGTPKLKSIPFIVIWLIFGALFLTFKMGFINVRGFRHAINLVRGKHDEPNAPGEVTHFQALATAVSATVGLGNIAGVAVAISVGGPGATFWMILAGILGMSSKFVECTLGVKYRNINKDGSVSGGPMHYLRKGLAARNMGGLGKVLAVIFALLAVGGSLGGGNMFQANQAYEQLSGEFPTLQGAGPYFGAILAILVGIVIVGGLKSIVRVTEKIVPFMAALYVIAALVIIFRNIHQVDSAFLAIFDGAFSAEALRGGFIGVLIQGFRRATFSNEAGIGSAAIAHSAAKTKFPVAEGFVALLEPFIDTVVVCTLTALVLIFTDKHLVTDVAGAQLTSDAFGTVISWFPLVLVIAIFLFAFSTMISWSYYGLKAWTFLLGENNRTELIYKFIFLIFVVIGSSVSLGAVIDFSDMMILAMAFPNIMGLLLLSGEVRSDLRSYLRMLRSGEIFTKPGKAREVT